jgi:hypothetical protein
MDHNGSRAGNADPSFNVNGSVITPPSVMAPRTPAREVAAIRRQLGTCSFSAARNSVNRSEVQTQRKRKLRLAGLRAERAELYRIAQSRKLSDEMARKLVREVDLLEARFGTG